MVCQPCSLQQVVCSVTLQVPPAIAGGPKPQGNMFSSQPLLISAHQLHAELLHLAKEKCPNMLPDMKPIRVCTELIHLFGAQSELFVRLSTR